MSADNTLNIYAQSEGNNMGKLIATSTSSRGGAGIGGDDDYYCGSIAIYGGLRGSAGIGGGDSGSGGIITISGGTVNATGGNKGAGIGGGNGSTDNGTLQISDTAVVIANGTLPNSSDLNYYLVTITLEDVSAVTAVTSLTYALNNAPSTVSNPGSTSASGAISLYLPSGTVTNSAVAGGITYTGSITVSSNTTNSGTLNSMAVPTVSSVSYTLLNTNTSTTTAATGGTLAITFNMAMNTTAAGTVTFTPSGGSAITLSAGTWSTDKKTYTVPYSALLNGTQYTVGISGFKKVSGIEMAADFSHRFTTVANTAPTHSSGGNTTVTVTKGKKPNQSVGASASVTAIAGDNGVASVTIPDKTVTDLITKAQADAKAQGKTANGIAIEMNVIMPKGAISLTAALSRNALNSLVSAGVTSLKLNGSPVKVTFDAKALAEIQKQSSGSISISIVSNAKLSSAAKAMIGARPVYDLTVNYTKNGKNATVSSFGGGTATISIPYALGKKEAAGGLYAVYVDERGNATRIAGSAYDTNSGCVIFTTSHFSRYGVGYTALSAKFTDISTHWAKESIDYVVVRGLLSGTSETTFTPDSTVTRELLVTALGRLANVDTKAYPTSSFADVKADSAFRSYIEWAYKKGIIQGTENGKFEPERAVTREEIAVIFANYAKAIGYTLPVTRTATIYADASSIGSTYKTAVTAMQQAGIMMGGTGNQFNPKSSATRAEVSSMLSRYIKLTIDPDTAQAWAKNDAGQYLYYKNGKALTGTQTIDGVTYFFNTHGTLKTGWVKDGDNWRFYSGKTMLVDWWDLGANGSNKTYYFTKSGLMVSGKWLEVDGKWYYFYADGSLARSTTVDGYKVDASGVRKDRVETTK